MKAKAKKGKKFTGFRPSPHRARPILNNFISRTGKSPSKGKPKPKAKGKTQTKKRNKKMADQKQLDAVKEAASRISGKIRNLENEINSTRSTPPDPNLALKFDEIQAELEQLKNPETIGSAPAEGKDKDDNDKKAGHKK